MQELEITSDKVLKVWWSWLWRTMLFALIAGFVLGLVVGIFGAFAGYDAEQLDVLVTLLGFLIGLYVSYAVFARTLNKRFGSFRIALVKIEE